MRVLFVAEAFGGGVFELVRWSAEGVAAAGHQVGIAFGRRPETPLDPAEKIDSAVELFDLPWTDRTPGAQLAGARALRRLSTAWKPDVVHIYSAFAGVIAGMVLPQELPTVFTPQAYAFTMRDSSPGKRAAFRLLESFASRRTTVVGACSEDEARLARRTGASWVETVPNGIPELNPPRLPDRSRLDDRVVIALGRTVPQRRPLACARILSQVSDVADVAWIGGAGGSRGREGAAALQAAGIPPSGWKDRSAVLAELEAATAYLHWTAWDGLPLSVLEAMALDTVVVASDIGPNRELLGGRQVCASEAEAASLLRRVLQDRELAQSMLDEQRSRRGAYGADEMVGGWLSLYGKILSRRGRTQSAP